MFRVVLVNLFFLTQPPNVYGKRLHSLVGRTAPDLFEQPRFVEGRVEVSGHQLEQFIFPIRQTRRLTVDNGVTAFQVDDQARSEYYLIRGLITDVVVARSTQLRPHPRE